MNQSELLKYKLQKSAQIYFIILCLLLQSPFFEFENSLNILLIIRNKLQFETSALLIKRLSTHLGRQINQFNFILYFIFFLNFKTEINAECLNLIWGLANDPLNYEDLILKFIDRSGKQINDFGRYSEWMSDVYETRYMIVTYLKSPVGLNFGFWGPAQWTESDYNALKSILSEFNW